MPGALVAQTPTPRRGDSRLLVLARHGDSEPFRDRQFGDLMELVAPEDVLVINTTKVRHARLLGRRPSGAPAEVLLIHPGTEETWIAIGKPGRAMRPGHRITLGAGIEMETIDVLEGGERVIRFIGGSAEEAIRRYGTLPLPPYIHRPPDEADEMRYQTVYADREGSVAAPTAGLHFTTDLLEMLRKAGVHIAGVDLEVGPGTFRPVEESDITEHRMHRERYHVPEATSAAIADARARNSRVWAIGTTVVRTLESAALGDGHVAAGAGTTQLMITPGYRFMVVDALVTNFHLPRSTLLMLVCAFAGTERTLAAYRHAVQEQYRFYSYGDAMVIV